MSGAVSIVRCLFIPLQDTSLLLPSTVVAEIVPYADAEPPEGEHPEWYLGLIEWREQQVPLVSMDALLTGQYVPLGARARIVILKTLGDLDTIPYFGVITKQIPRLAMVYDGGIEVLEDEFAGNPAVAAEVLANGEPAIIPEMDRIKQMIRAVILDADVA
jgi:chemosensory pili system protein ChpC